MELVAGPRLRGCVLGGLSYKVLEKRGKSMAENLSKSKSYEMRTQKISESTRASTLQSTASLVETGELHQEALDKSELT